MLTPESLPWYSIQHITLKIGMLMLLFSFKLFLSAAHCTTTEHLLSLHQKQLVVAWKPAKCQK
jgi:hypothetical protein